MGAKVSRGDFEWVYNDEPHGSRRKEMLKKYPQIKQLFNCDGHFVYIVTALVATQIIACYFVKDMSWPAIIIFAYTFGAILNQSLSLAVHDICHNGAFGFQHATRNRYFGMIANLPLGVPMSISFKKYHLDHHRYLGSNTLDVDLPTRFEAIMFKNTFLKIIWLFLNPFFYVFRPFFINPKPINILEIHNALIQILFDIWIFYMWGPKPLVYFFIGLFFSMGIHPIAGHFISEHFMYTQGFETYSYYGCLNRLTFNVGYHVEHHDFPAVASTKLPLIKKIAPDYYDDLPCYSSWCKVLWDFVFNPDIGPYARVRREDDINEKSQAKEQVQKPEDDTNPLAENGYHNGCSNGHVQNNMHTVIE